MNCQDYAPLLSAYLDRELSAEDQKEVARHLEACAACRQESKTLLALKEVLRTQALPGMPADLMAEIEAKTLFRRPWWDTEWLRRRWAPAMVGVAAALGAWLLLRYHQATRMSAPIEVSQKQPIQEHTRVVLHHEPPAEESPDCHDTTQGC